MMQAEDDGPAVTLKQIANQLLKCGVHQTIWCKTCGRQIEPGSMYRREVWSVDGEIAVRVEHENAPTCELALRFEVTVGNIGSVYRSDNSDIAWAKWAEYVEDSKTGLGRAGGEEVVLWDNGEPKLIHEGTVDKGEE
jgi:hypothetical protein